jgi:hypothetical protein
MRNIAPTRVSHRVYSEDKDALRGFRSCHTGAGPCPAAHRAGDYSVDALLVKTQRQSILALIAAQRRLRGQIRRRMSQAALPMPTSGDSNNE